MKGKALKKYLSTYVNTVYPTTGLMPAIGSKVGNNTPYGSTYTCAPITSGSVLTTSGSGPALNGIQFNLSAFATFGSFPAFISAFDQYRVREIEIWLTPGITQAESGAPENAPFVSVVDLDDSYTGGSTLLGLMQKPGALVSSVFESHYHRFVPKLSSVAWDGSFTAGFIQPNDQPWCDTVDSNIQYYGIKIAIGATSTSWNVNAIIRYHLEFRGVFG
jgi:hypothetical protein